MHYTNNFIYLSIGGEGWTRGVQSDASKRQRQQLTKIQGADEFDDRSTHGSDWTPYGPARSGPGPRPRRAAVGPCRRRPTYIDAYIRTMRQDADEEECNFPRATAEPIPVHDAAARAVPGPGPGRTRALPGPYPGRGFVLRPQSRVTRVVRSRRESMRGTDRT